MLVFTQDTKNFNRDACLPDTNNRGHKAERLANPYHGAGGLYVWAGCCCQPSTTSSTIMSTKPRAKPMVARLECSPSLDSGMSSSTTT